MTYAQEYYAKNKERMKRQTVAARKRRRRQTAAENTPPSPTLSPREHQVLELLVRGLLNKEIAARLFLAEGTVKVVTGRIYVKLHVRNRAEAVRWACEH